jgi:hypothetical protein
LIFRSFNNAFSTAKLKNDCEQIIKKDLEERGRELYTPEHFPGVVEDNYENPLSEQPVFKTRYEPAIYRIPNRTDNYGLVSSC